METISLEKECCYFQLHSHSLYTVTPFLFFPPCFTFFFQDCFSQMHYTIIQHCIFCMLHFAPLQQFYKDFFLFFLAWSFRMLKKKPTLRCGADCFSFYDITLTENNNTIAPLSHKKVAMHFISRWMSRKKNASEKELSKVKSFKWCPHKAARIYKNSLAI